MNFTKSLAYSTALCAVGMLAANAAVAAEKPKLKISGYQETYMGVADVTSGTTSSGTPTYTGGIVDGAAAVVIDCMGDPGLVPARESVGTLVLGPCQTSMHVAALLGHRFSVVTVLDHLAVIFEDLASRGYVVASVDHTYEATAVEFPDGRVIRSIFGSYLGGVRRTNRQALTFAVSVRLRDLEAVVDDLERLNAEAGGRFAGKLDKTRIAVAGHSLGGLTAILGVDKEPRFRAAINLEGGVPLGLIPSTATPVLILAAGREWWSESDRHLWNELRGPRFAVNLEGSEHVTPSDAVWLAKGAVKAGSMGPDKAVAAIRNYIAAFLDAYLRGRPMNPLLTGGSPDYPDATVTLQDQSLRQRR